MMEVETMIRNTSNELRECIELACGKVTVVCEKYKSKDSWLRKAADLTNWIPGFAAITADSLYQKYKGNIYSIPDGNDDYIVQDQPNLFFGKTPPKKLEETCTKTKSAIAKDLKDAMKDLKEKLKISEKFSNQEKLIMLFNIFIYLMKTIAYASKLLKAATDNFNAQMVAPEGYSALYEALTYYLTSIEKMLAKLVRGPIPHLSPYIMADDIPLDSCGQIKIDQSYAMKKFINQITSIFPEESVIGKNINGLKSLMIQEVNIYKSQENLDVRSLCGFGLMTFISLVLKEASLEKRYTELSNRRAVAAGVVGGASASFFSGGFLLPPTVAFVFAAVTKMYSTEGVVGEASLRGVRKGCDDQNIIDFIKVVNQDFEDRMNVFFKVGSAYSLEITPSLSLKRRIMECKKKYNVGSDKYDALSKLLNFSADKLAPTEWKAKILKDYPLAFKTTPGFTSTVENLVDEWVQLHLEKEQLANNSIFL